MKLLEKCDNALQELYKFSEDILYLGEPITASRIEILEQEIGYKLPEEFVYILKKHNGIILCGTEVYGLASELRGRSLDIIYKFEHFEVENPMPVYFFPFSPDGRGNHYCLDLSKAAGGMCPVVFWQWDFEYNDFDSVEVSNNSFTEWVNEVLIEWTKETYNYDGTEK
ncbi:SMI1/KNR4 family protein [Chryseobacterium fluminis]|uniref:SMI1/KNR4 family protein n=1 Tax=Chryseobacterium fluminis TaxID=2983606 RepID=UPI00224DC9B9|nr:SMI1/KNR4 family protein [Chryseobacterium sp. MMS21-Ot14]UZT99053.1 SMI1/KNR4 family protein [Chryseobacterium sp. MMS21-Ot14]